jgi:peptidoglycan/xylan/chitin deacetylase (PgdA/CDA1 family)
MPQPLVLAYHALSADWPSTLAVPPDQLREQLERLVARGYRGATFTEVVRGEAPGRSVAVTFDDGCRSVLERGLPILSDLGLPGTVFVPTDFVGSDRPMSWPGIERWTGTPHESELLCLGWDQLRELREAGWEIASHTRSHPHLTAIGDESLAAELSASRAELSEGLGARCTSIAYPYGDHDDRVCRAARTAGYEGGGTMRPGPPDPFRYPRIGVFPADIPWRFRTKTSPSLRRLRASRLGMRLERRRQQPAGTG